jgi:hypothetical protein
MQLLAILRTLIPPCLLALGIFQTYEGKYLPHIRTYMEQSHTANSTVSSSDTQNTSSDASSSNGADNSTTQESEGTTASAGESQSTSVRKGKSADPSQDYKYQEELLLKMFFVEMKKKNYSAADEFCAQIEKLAEDSGDPRKIQSAKELRRTYQAIVE